MSTTPTSPLSDEQYITYSIALGLRARLLSPPNPWVGCILVKNGKIVGEGSTQAVGKPHAEVIALAEAGDSATGATAYISLEPCAHHGRTPPCVKALIDAKIARAVIAIEDPDPRVCGRGVAALRSAGISVTLGVCKEAAEQALCPYLYHRSSNLPYCILKSAVSIDGRTAAADGSSQWITSPEARRDVHAMRAESQAIAIGARTAIIDNPLLTVREGGVNPPTPPLRVLIDGSGIAPASLQLLDCSLAPTLIATTNKCPLKRRQEWEKCGAEVIVFPAEGNEIDLHSLCTTLAKRGVLQLLVEGGSCLHSNFIAQKLFNRITLYIGALILGPSGIAAFSQLTINTLTEALALKPLSATTIGTTVRLDYEP